MATKFCVSYAGSTSSEKVESLKRSVADALGVPAEDVVVLPERVSVCVLDVPDTLVKARQKADEEAEREAEKARKEAERQEAEAVRAQTEEANRAAAAAPAPPPPGYDEWTLEDLRAEAQRRDLHGRSGMDKAALVKALAKADRGA